MTITTWSYSAYALYTECAYKFYLEKIEKREVPTPPAFIKGRKAHEAIEDYLKKPNETPFPTVGSKFSKLIKYLAAHPRVFVEQSWAFNRNWGESRWSEDNTTWLRAKCDAGVHQGDNVIEIVDWKTGKKYGENEDQVELFALTAMMRYKEAPHVFTTLAYLDGGEEVPGEYSANDREKLKAKWEKKVVPMFTDTVFAPRPNDRCSWCHFRNSNGGPCKFG